jgi:restriction system protein
MSRSYIAMLNRLARDAERAAHARVREQAAFVRQQQKEASLLSKQQQNDAKLLSKQEQLRYYAERLKSVDDLNKRLSAAIDELQNLLSNSIDTDPHYDLSKLKNVEPTEAILGPRPELRIPPKPSRQSPYIKPVGFFARLMPGARAKHVANAAAAEMEANLKHSVNYKTMNSKSSARRTTMNF